jgi:hypothetical protein
MKKLLFLLAFLPVLALAQTPPITGCLGLKFGISQDEAIHQLACKMDTAGLLLINSQNAIALSNVNFADELFDNIFLSFFDGKLYRISFNRKFENFSDMESMFSSLKSSYKTKYNDPFFENDHLLKWIDKLHHSSILVGYIAIKNDVILTYLDDQIEKQASLKKLQDL